MPSRFSIELIWGPPPWTTTGFRPTRRRKTMSSAKARFRPSSNHGVATVFDDDSLA